MEPDNEFVSDSPSVIYGHKFSQTRNAKWLCIKNIYEKFYRSNLYDLGGTYIEDVADYWFRFKTEQVGDIFLLHLFVSNNQECSFAIAVSYNSHATVDKKHGISYLTKSLKQYQFETVKPLTENYITTYNFTSYDIELFKDRKMYIAVKFPQIEAKNQQVIDDVKYNHDFGALLIDPIGSDFIIESEDGEKFQVHKALLTAHSDYFKAMLKEDTAESQNSYVKLIGVNKEDLKCILEFIYCGMIKDLENANWINLLMLSDLYNLKGLRELSQHALSQQLNADNALEILSVADMYNSYSLKVDAMKYLKMNVSVLNASTFTEINNPDLLRELCLNLVAN